MVQTRWRPNATDTCFGDGNQVIAVVRFDDSEVPEPPSGFLDRYGLTGEQLRRSTAPPIFATISPGAVPLEHFGVNLPWLVLCSPIYLDVPNRILQLPEGYTRHVPDSFGYADKTDRFTDSLSLPVRIEWIAEERLMSRAPRHWSVQRRGRSTAEIRTTLSGQPDVPHGFKRATYEVTRTTNVFGRTLPLEFRYMSFLPDERRQEPLLNLDALGEIQLIGPSDAPAWPLEAGHRYNVTDYRFRHSRRLVDFIRYQITNGLVPPKSDALLLEAYEKAVASAPVDEVIRARYGFYAIYALFVLLPIITVLLWLRGVHQRKRNVPTS